MDKLVELIKLLEKLFGKGSVSRTIGTRTNVVRFPKGKQPVDPTTGEFRIEELKSENPDSYQIIKNSIEDRMGDIIKMNDSELLNYTANVRRMVNAEFPPPLPEADIVKFGSGQEIKGKGLEELIEKQGTRFSPTTDIGQLEATGKRLEKLSEDFAREFDPANIAKQEAERRAMIARQYESKGFAGDVISGPSGIFRAVSREFLLDQNAKGKIKLTPETVKNLENRDYISGGQPLMYPDPIRIMRHHYGDDVFDKIPLDKLYRSSGARSDILEVMSKVEAPPIKTEPPKTPGGYLTPGEYRANIEEMQKIEDAIKRRESRFADMTEEEIQNELSQYGGKRSSFEMGLEQDYPEEFAKYKKPKDIDEPEEKADGGRIGFSKGKKVKSQIDKLIEQLNKKTKGKKSMESVDPKTGEVTVPKRPIRRAEEPTGMTTMDPEPEIVDERSVPGVKEKKALPTEKQYYMYDKNDEYDKLVIKHKKAAEAHDQLDNIDIYDKIAPDQLGEVIAEMEGKNIDRLTDAQRREYYKIAQSYLTDFIKIDRTRRAVEKVNEGLDLTATDRFYLKFAQPENKSKAVTVFEQPTIEVENKIPTMDDKFFQGDFKEAMQEAVRQSNKMKDMGLDPSKIKDYEEFEKITKASGGNKILDDLELKTRFKGVISDDLLDQVLTDTDPQRKAEVIASIEEALTLQEKGMGAGEIIDILRKTPRTKQADGGIAGLL